jgi:ribose 5-phosphate isomerase A
VTDNGNFVIDVDFGVLDPSAVGQLNRNLREIVGIVETGLFVGMAQKAYFGNTEGQVTTR